MDESVGHYRRYEYKEIKIKCEKAGFKIKKIHYVDSIGFFASLAIKFFLDIIQMMVWALKSLSNFMISIFSQFLRFLTSLDSNILLEKIY